MLMHELIAQNNLAVIAENCNLGGRRNYLQAGIYRASQLGIGDNTLSSFYLPDNMALQVFESDSYRGKTETFFSSIQCMPASWDNRVSSIKLYWIHDPGNEGSGSGGYLPPQGNEVIAYRDINYSGPAITINAGNFGSGTLGTLAGEISSIYIPQGTSVSVRDRNNLSQTLTASVIDLAKIRWDDRIQSGFIDKNFNGGNSGSNIPPQGNKVIVYQNSNYGGQAKIMEPGGFSSSDLGTLSGQVSSIYIPYGTTVQVFDRSGKTRHFSTSISSLLTYGWDNAVYSGSIIGSGGSSSTVNLYEDPNYRGKEIKCQEGRINFLGNNVGITSIQIPPGYAVTVYNGPNLSGNYRTFTKSVTSLTAYPGWDNRVVSVFVFKL